MTGAVKVAFIALLVIILALIVVLWIQGSQITDLRADRDEDREKLADVTADVAEERLLHQQTRTRLTQLANHVVAAEQPSTGRHARAELEAA